LGMLYEPFVGNRDRKMRVRRKFRPTFAGFHPETTETIVSEFVRTLEFAAPSFGRNFTKLHEF
jgi:hypothetical protein